ncbi:PaaX family transcriptional regulator [Streptomyces sp. AC536]|uniref:PaaX family transcriptional regulator n=1 Tax=Streptomyces buecherae TaxID=2763006 RepID=UPI00164E4AB7|nr:PaaX family transcriptional regulator C-terminal domain-containing protein [Streptomyces buecherae]MBC3981892.1 PaaX family transcriptional regulator [Streptomyces buecherae]QNJ39598.1 PaaX family transcriptional regulator [Streptomyces buecherae]
MTDPLAQQHTPRSLIVTYYGAYGRGAGGEPETVPVAALIRLLGAVGVDPPSVRSAVSRLKRRGLLVAAKTARGAAGYAPSPDAVQLLDDGDRRIYGRLGAYRLTTRPAGAPDASDAPDAADAADAPGAAGVPGGGAAAPGDWLLAVFSVPEHERNKRHLLRSRLARLGFGTAAPGVWIAPAHLYEETRHTLRRLGLDGYVDLFRGAHAGFEATADAVRRWWDLEALAARHHAFLATHEPVLRRWSRRTTVPPADAYRDYLLALDSWRALPYADPGLPPALLPKDWPGERSARVFAGLHERLRDAGAAFARDGAAG